MAKWHSPVPRSLTRGGRFRRHASPEPVACSPLMAAPGSADAGGMDEIRIARVAVMVAIVLAIAMAAGFIAG
jgi:hypothetical protein